MFAFLMHPVERAAFLYEYMKSPATTTFTNTGTQSVPSTLLEYARDRVNQLRNKKGKIGGNIKNFGVHGGVVSESGAISPQESNFLVRSLAQVPMDVPLHGGHVAHAEQVVRHYLLLGLMETKDQLKKSWKRIHTFFGWDGEDSCIQMFLPSLSSTRMVPLDSEEYALLAELNEYDMMFYDSLPKVFEEQGNLPMLKGL